MQLNKAAHRDIKPQNILKYGNNYIISDLGCAFKKDRGIVDTITGTPAYLSPLLRKAYNDLLNGYDISNFIHDMYKSDVFSLGLTFLYMASLNNTNDLCTLDENLYSRILEKRLSELRYSDFVKNLLRNMLDFYEQRRWDFIMLESYFGKKIEENELIRQNINYPKSPLTAADDQRFLLQNINNFSPPLPPVIDHPIINLPLINYESIRKDFEKHTSSFN